MSSVKRIRVVKNLAERQLAIEFPTISRAGLALNELIYKAYDQQMAVVSRTDSGG